jgi:hypothetical protein
LAGWLLAGWLLAGWLAGWLAGCWLAWLAAGWLAAGWLAAGWLAGCWQAGWLAGHWLAGLAGWLLAGCWLADPRIQSTSPGDVKGNSLGPYSLAQWKAQGSRLQTRDCRLQATDCKTETELQGSWVLLWRTPDSSAILWPAPRILCNTLASPRIPMFCFAAGLAKTTV